MTGAALSAASAAIAARARALRSAPRIALVLVSVVVGLAACSASAAQRDPQTLVILEAADAKTFNPLFTTDAQSNLDQSFILESLVAVGNDFTDRPWLATSWTPSADKLHWLVHLRRGVTWSDGAPFTAADVAFTWRTALDPKTAFPYAGQFDYIKRVTALDRYTVRFDLSHTNALFVSEGLGTSILPEHILGSIPPAQQRVSSFAEHPIGTGPYLLESWRHDEAVTFRRNPHWWHGMPTVPRIEMRIALDDQARIAAIQDGSGDVLDGVGVNSFIMLQHDSPQLKLLKIPDLYTVFIYTNNRRAGLRDNRVRQAMLYGWDRQAIVSGFMRNDGIVSTGVVPIGLKRWYDPDVRRYPYDPEKARALLDAAGWRPGRDGMRHRGNERLAFVMLIGGAGGGSTDVPAEFQYDMQQIGIAITVRALDFATFIGKIDETDFDLAFSSWGGVPDPDMYTLLESTQTPPRGNNVMGYSNKVVDRDVTLGLQTLDPAKRRAYYDQMQWETAQDLPSLFAWYGYYQAAFNPRVKLDFSTALPDQYLFRNVWEWKLGKL